MVCGVIRHIDVHVQVGQLLVCVALRPGTLGWRRQAQFGQFSLLLLQTLFAPLDASVLEPDFDLSTKEQRHSKRTAAHADLHFSHICFLT